MSKWRRYDVASGDSLPSSKGVYCLYLAGNLVYIGRAKSFRQRIMWHPVAFDAVKIREFHGGEDEYGSFELALIGWLNPPLNKTLHGRLRSPANRTGRHGRKAIFGGNTA